MGRGGEGEEGEGEAGGADAWVLCCTSHVQKDRFSPSLAAAALPDELCSH